MIDYNASGNKTYYINQIKYIVFFYLLTTDRIRRRKLKKNNEIYNFSLFNVRFLRSLSLTTTIFHSLHIICDPLKTRYNFYNSKRMIFFLSFTNKSLYIHYTLINQ